MHNKHLCGSDTYILLFSRSLLCSFFLCLILPLTPARAQDQPDYFRLEMGNWWLLAYILEPPDMPVDTVFVDTRVAEQLELDGETYFRFTPPFVDSDTIRVDEEGRVWSRGYGREDLLFDFTAAHDSVYQFSADREHGVDTLQYNIRVERNLTISTFTGEYDECIRFSFDVPLIVDEEISYTFSPDVGLVKISGAWVYGSLIAAQVGENAIVTTLERNESRPAMLNFSIYPNPATANSWLAIDLPFADQLILEIFDILGRRVMSQNLGQRSAGQHKIPLAVNDLASAPYLVHLLTANGAKATQMLIR